MNEEKNLKKNEKKSRKKNPKSVTTDKHLNHNAKKKTRNETSPLIIFQNYLAIILREFK